jgi:hypothetical protein
MNIRSFISGVLLAASLIIPSSAGAEEINLLCGEIHVKVDPERHMAFGHVNEVIHQQYGNTIHRVTINDEVYMYEDLADDFEHTYIMNRWTINRITGILTHCAWTYPSGRANCASTEPCQKISGAPKF